jgi:NitT/TauT family transport system permease protein
MAGEPTPTPPRRRRRRGRPLATAIARHFDQFVAFRKESPLWQYLLLGLAFVTLVLGAWWFVTRGESEERIISRLALTSPAETFAAFPELWSKNDLLGNTLTTLRRLVLGFGLAALIGVPLGVLCSCFPRLYAFLAPLTIFGRNIPVAALIPLLFLMVHGVELEKIIFIFVACVAFVIADTARAVADVGSSYIDTAYTLGASRRQVILKVLVPLAMPGIFNSLRLLFGIAFGYIMLSEVVVEPKHDPGLGGLINEFQRLEQVEKILLLLIVIPIIALVLDRAIYWVQCQLFPYRYGGSGYLHMGVRALLHGWEDVKARFRRRPALQPASPETSAEKS